MQENKFNNCFIASNENLEKFKKSVHYKVAKNVGDIGQYALIPSNAIPKDEIHFFDSKGKRTIIKLKPKN